jgi:DnaJ-class molecular chaperone
MNYYKLLNVRPDASEDEIKKQIRNLSLHVHPDKTKAEATSHLQVMLNEAKETLLDPDKRRQYDLELERNNGRNENDRKTQRQLQQATKEKEKLQATLQKERSFSQQQIRMKEEQLQQERSFSQQQIRMKEEQLQQEHQNQIAKFRCGKCPGIVNSNDFWQAACCKKLFCHECLLQCGNLRTCPNNSCGTPIPDNGEGWTKNNKLIQDLVESAAPSCKDCGKNIPKLDHEAHQRVCPATKQVCVKCNGNGICVRQVLFGAVTQTCDVCSGNGKLLGRWSPCYRCGCEGFLTQTPSSLAMDNHPTRVENLADRHQDSHNIMHSITAMDKYADKSFEELRLECYTYKPRNNTQRVPCDVCHGAKILEGYWMKCSKCNAGKIQMPGWAEILKELVLI